MNSILVEPIWTPEVQQAIFKKLLLAISYVGQFQELPAEVSPEIGAVAVLASLVDEACSYSNPHGILSPEQAHFLGSFEAIPGKADYVIADLAKEPDFEVQNGTIYRPEASATVIIQAPSEWPEGVAWRLRGPGIKDEELWGELAGLERWLAWRDSFIAYPMGIDLMICSGSKVVAIPRTTVVVKTKEVN